MTPVVVPAWWDPQARKVIFDDDTIVCGVLVACDTGVAFASPARLEFEAGPAGLRVTWSRLPGRCELHTLGATYRIYLAPPTDGSPRLSRDAVRSIAGHLTTTGDLAGLAGLVADLGVFGDVLGVGGHVGNSITFVHGVAALRRARRSRSALIKQFAILAERKQ
ncbi:hypothetical protein Aab01nite_05340 [Paractinoplanes abujensis]|uniref:Uncharacterized protein n=1 Tax=Paractinoplanes abujensis TaxID=882441 RepID=A0A7W7CN71_9ACTN|nr:hypothetical protein [Actinoplanes abujensis]MBB4691637.1 hypothetical protein [Actinoplanes abujensis]GID16944.1 hypothetical protein Aab01nite_05340 [Actinoplanes abujensis]